MAREDAISLHFGLASGESADLEVIASATLQWIGAIQAAAHALDPEAQVKVAIIDADQSSLRLNTILSWAEDQLARLDRGSSKYPRLRKLAVALAIFLIIDAPLTFDHYTGETTTIELSEDDRRRLDEFLEKIRRTPDFPQPRQGFFRELERDPSISSVEVSEGPDTPSLVSVPRAEFPERGGLWVMEEAEQERTIHHILDVVLISPVLINEPRAWHFAQEGLPEFRAIMKDRRFLAALEQQHVQERLRTGIRMRIQLEIKEYWKDNAWKVRRKGRSVTQVISPTVD